MSGTLVTGKTSGLALFQGHKEGGSALDCPSLPKSRTSIVLGGYPCRGLAQWPLRAGLRGEGHLHLGRRAPRTVEEGRRCPSEGAPLACCHFSMWARLCSVLVRVLLLGLSAWFSCFRLYALGVWSRVGIVGGVSAVGFSLMSTVSSPGPSGSALGGGGTCGSGG